MWTTINNLIVAFDRVSLHALNSLAGLSAFTDELFVTLAEGVVFILIGGFLMYLYKSSKSSNRGLLLSEAFVAVIVARFIFVTGIRLLHFRFRPFVFDHVLQIVPHSPLEASFPSGHAAVMASLAMTLWYMNKKLGMVFALAAVISGLSRVVVGVHYPLDIVAGLACGVISAVIARRIYTIAVHEKAFLTIKRKKSS